MKYAVNFINYEVLNLTNENETYIKYPGGKWDFETLKGLTLKNYKIILHGVIPSSGSILDPKLCEKFDEFSKYVELTKQSYGKSCKIVFYRDCKYIFIYIRKNNNIRKLM